MTYKTPSRTPADAAEADEKFPSGPAEDHVHTMFGLTYANYLVLPRTLLQSMPDVWQAKFVGLIEQYDAAFRHVLQADNYRVTPVGAGGKFASDPVPHYNRGRTYVAPCVQVVDDERAMLRRLLTWMTDHGGGSGPLPECRPENCPSCLAAHLLDSKVLW